MAIRRPCRRQRATAGFWKVTFIPPVAGRYFTEAEDREGAPRVVVLSYALWQNRFGGTRDIVGRAITLEGQPVTVIGVAPPDYILNPPAERIWIPMASPAWRFTDFWRSRVSGFWIAQAGRVGRASRSRQLTEIDTRLAHEHPHSNYDGGVIATPLIDSIVGPAPDATLHAVRRRGARAAHRVRQHRQPSSRARSCATRRDRRARCTRRHAGEDRVADARGEQLAGHWRWTAGRPGCCRRRSLSCEWTGGDSALAGHDAERAGARVHRAGVDGVRDRFWTRAGNSCGAARSAADVARRRPRLGRCRSRDAAARFSS